MSKKARKQEKEGNEGSKRGWGVTQRKPKKSPHSKKTWKNKGTEKNRESLKCKEAKQSQAVWRPING